MLSVTFENLSKRFGSAVAVDDLSLEIPASELFFFLGPSGCGKTTSLRMVAGFETPSSGVLRFGEKEMTRVPPHKRNTGMVFQNYALWPHMTTKANVEYGLRVRKIERKEREHRVREALEMVRLGHLAERFPSQMSGGQQQRVALARALVIRPDVLLLDEPLSNLDAQLRLEMRAEIKRLHEQTGTTALYVTHDQEEALSIADRVAVLKDGVLQQVGTPREIYQRPASRFVAEFIGETNLIPGSVKSMDAEYCEIETPVGVLLASRPERPIEIGENVYCSIRPESWHVSKENQAQAQTQTRNRLSSQLMSVMYLGAREQYQVLLTGGGQSRGESESWRHVKIAVSNPRTAPPQAGSTLMLSCDPAEVVVLNR